MSSTGSATAFEIYPRTSSRFTILMSLLHLLSLAAVVSVVQTITLPGVIIISAAVLASLYLNLLRQNRIQRILWQGDNRWQLTLTDGRELSAEILGDSIVLPYLVILNFRLPQQPMLHRRRSKVIFPDALSEEKFRQLRVCLRLMVNF
ncbi:MAG: hypothetical protein BMS9Abin26_0136 [Gammaproteobacteria bacterium]|nr:MAG: hypothetical protein BMS9Abin26_0136 [Gammaproteobacteria bacterium]